MTIFTRECRARLKSTLIWSAVAVVLAYLSMWKFGNLAATGDSMTQLFASMPKVLMAFFGMVGLDVNRSDHYFGVVHVFLLAMGGVFAAMAGAGALADEESDKTADFLLTRPVTRVGVLTQKLLAVLLQIVVFCVFTVLGSVASYTAETGEPFPYILPLGMFITMLYFAALGFGIAALSRRPKRSASLSAMTLLGFYLLGVLYQSSDALRILRFVTPFEYASALRLLNGWHTLYYFGLSLLLTAAFIAAAYLRYPKRDIMT